MPGLALSEMRLALLEKRAHALDAVVGFHARLLRAAFRPQLLFERVVERRGVQRAYLADDRGRSVGERARDVLRAPEHFGVGGDRVGKPPGVRGPRIDLLGQ